MGGYFLGWSRREMKGQQGAQAPFSQEAGVSNDV